MHFHFRACVWGEIVAWLNFLLSFHFYFFIGGLSLASFEFVMLRLLGKLAVVKDQFKSC